MAKMIKVTCMGETKQWENRERAIAYYSKKAVSSTGVIQANNIMIINQLNSGRYICSDITP